MKKVLSMLLVLAMLTGMVLIRVFAADVVIHEENPWQGKSVVFVGDSITAGVGTTKIYHRYLDETLEFGSVITMGVAGSCISAASDYGQSNQPLINRYQNIPSADLIVIFMGTNDYGHETPLGSVEDAKDGSFYGALNVIIPQLKSKHPSSKLVFVTPMHRYGFGTSKILGTSFTFDNIPNGVDATLEDYVQALKTVCAANDVSVIDLYIECPLDPADASVRSAYIPDGLHPNAAGHELIAGIIGSHIQNMEPAERTPETETGPEGETALIYGNKFASGFAQQNRASARTNQYLKTGTVITLKNPDVFQWACVKTDGEYSSKNLGYFPDSAWSDKETAIVALDGWVGFVFKYRDETQSFDVSKPLLDYITIEEPHTHSYTPTITAPTCAEKGYTTYTCICGDTYVADEVAALGHNYVGNVCEHCGDTIGITVSGVITSFGDAASEVTVKLLSGDVEVAAVTSTDGTYSLLAPAAGTYTLTVAKANHATRTYEITVADTEVTQNVKIHLKGDIDGNGLLNVLDVNRANAHSKGKKLLTGYELACADLDSNGSVNVLDVNRMNAHSKGKKLLW